MDYDSIEKGFTLEFIKQLELSIFPDVLMVEDDNNINHIQCSAYIELRNLNPVHSFILNKISSHQLLSINMDH